MSETHAYLVIASSIEDAGIADNLKRESADVRHLITDSFGIDDARRLKEMSSEKSFSGKDHVFVIATKSLTGEAQNAILKLFEDPPSGAVFYLLVPSDAALLPTLKSRLLKINKDAVTQNVLSIEFIRSSYKERLEWIADKAKNDPSALQDLVRELGRDLSKNIWTPTAKQALFTATKYMYNRGAAKKMLLEEVALSLPINK